VPEVTQSLDSNATDSNATDPDATAGCRSPGIAGDDDATVRGTRSLRLGVAGPVGTGKSSLIALICRELAAELSLGVLTNDIYTDEDARLLRSAGVLAPERQPDCHVLAGSGRCADLRAGRGRRR